MKTKLLILIFIQSLIFMSCSDNKGTDINEKPKPIEESPTSDDEDYKLITKNPTQNTLKVWRFLHSIYGKKMLTGVWTESQYGGNAAVVSCSGKHPAIWGQDMNSWHSDRNGHNWKHSWANHIAQTKAAYNRGQIIQINWHWQGPHMLNNGAYKEGSRGIGMGAWSKLTKEQWDNLIKPGTELYNKMIEDIDYHVTNFLKNIVDEQGEPIPILFRPLHEIDGGWFWWTCEYDPTKTVALWNILFDRINQHHNMKNLIWVWSNGVLCNGGSWPPYEPSEYERRKDFYPGDTKCDIIGIDLYGFDPVNRGTYYPKKPRTYRDAWKMLKAVSQTKMIAMCEAEALPDADKFLDKDYAPWLYSLPWFSNNYNDEFTKEKVPLCKWNNKQFNHKTYITADEIDFK